MKTPDSGEYAAKPNAAPLLPQLDCVTIQAAAQLAGWHERERATWDEIEEKAHSDLQRELLLRSLAAGHSADEIQSFAEMLRPLTDAEIFGACTLDSDRTALEALDERLWAESDPLYAYVLNGYQLAGPRTASTAKPSGPPKKVRLPPGMMLEPPSVPTLPRAVEIDEALDISAPLTRRPSPSAGRFAEDLFNEATREMDIYFGEQPVDLGGLTLERALDEAAAALARGIPIPVILGRRAGDFRRYALILQHQSGASGRAFQIHDPFANETVWTNERDLLKRAELPLSDKASVRITAIALPKTITRSRSLWKR